MTFALRHPDSVADEVHRAPSPSTARSGELISPSGATRESSRLRSKAASALKAKQELQVPRIESGATLNLLLSALAVHLRSFTGRAIVSVSSGLLIWSHVLMVQELTGPLAIFHKLLCLFVLQRLFLPHHGSNVRHMLQQRIRMLHSPTRAVWPKLLRPPNA